MYSIGKYSFAGFKHSPGHRANYAVIPKQGNSAWGLKYSASYSYAREYDILDIFSHPQIPKRYDLGKENLFENEDSIFKMHYIVLQHRKGIDIVEYFTKKRLPNYLKIKEIAYCFSSISDPLQYIHSKGYIYADIKPGHLILNPNTGIISLIDLELAVKMGEPLKGMTIEYASPEQKQMKIQFNNLTDSEHENPYDRVKVDGRTDLYSIGLIMYEVLTKKLWAYTRVALSKINNQIPQRLNEIILGLLEELPSDRISSAEI